MYGQLIRIGKELLKFGINASHSGNISVREREYIHITRSGSSLSNLNENDFVKLLIQSDEIKNASREIVVHRAIYKNTNYAAVLHTHPPYTVSISFSLDSIIPIDSEGLYFLKNVSVFTAAKTIGASEVAQKICPLLKENPIVVLKSHGVFAAAQNIEDAHLLTTTLEKSAQIIYLTKTFSAENFRRESLKAKRKLLNI